MVSMKGNNMELSMWIFDSYHKESINFIVVGARGFQAARRPPEGSVIWAEGPDGKRSKGEKIWQGLAGAGMAAFGSGVEGRRALGWRKLSNADGRSRGI